MNYIKKLVLSIFLLFTISQINAYDVIGNNNYDNPYNTSGYTGGLSEIKDHLDNIVVDQTLSEFIQNVVQYGLTFISIIAVVYIIYAGFRILTSSGSDDALKKSRTTIVYVFIGIVIIWLAWSIVLFILGILEGSSSTDSTVLYIINSQYI
ncbi:MAG: hypothetical protein PHN31_00170 [Candidatus Gracilibacteria bacterium]|nr:hypothetical protein [Candidatus Gracilibacteria bacterium]